jgi:hypothetical protein
VGAALSTRSEDDGLLSLGGGGEVPLAVTGGWETMTAELENSYLSR